MKLKIAQDHTYAGHDYWNWRAWIEGRPADLERIEKVKWFLHPSFAQSVVVSRERATGFRIEASGWGTFTLRAEARCVDGTVETLRQPLRLNYPEGTRPSTGSAADAAPSRGVPEDVAGSVVGSVGAEPGVEVFLSFASADRSAALPLRRALETAGLVVLDDASIGVGLPFELALQDLLARADAMVAFVSSELPSPFVAQGIVASAKSGKPTLVVTPPDVGAVAGVPSSLMHVRLDPSDGAAVATLVRQLLGR